MLFYVLFILFSIVTKIYPQYSKYQNLVSCLRVNDTPFYVYTTFCWAIHPSVNIWIIFTFWLFWIMLQWACICKYLLSSFNSFGNISKRWHCWIILGKSYGHFMFNFLKRTIFGIYFIWTWSVLLIPILIFSHYIMRKYDS